MDEEPRVTPNTKRGREDAKEGKHNPPKDVIHTITHTRAHAHGVHKDADAEGEYPARQTPAFSASTANVRLRIKD